MKNFLELYRAGSVKRWHTKITIKDQDLAAHQWGVVMILMHIYPEAPSYLIEAALTHDLHEVESGDVPYPFKKKYKEIGRQYAMQASQFSVDNDLKLPSKDREEHLLKWCDMFELLLWSQRERRMGNQYMDGTIMVATAALREMGPPNQVAQELFDEVMNVR